MSQKLVDVIIVGAGFAGLYMLHKVRQLGLSAQVFETGEGVGGTWYWNRYPGARCDVESMEYSYQFSEELQQAWRWSERYAAQPEILRYANHVADRFALRDGIQFQTRVVSAHFDETSARWKVNTQTAEDQTYKNFEHWSSRFVVLATGCLSSANKPSFEGADQYLGESFHTGQWPHEPVDFTGKTVGIIGTGSSAIQSIPVIAQQAEKLYVFQRTPSYAVPAHNGPIDAAHEAKVKADYAGFRARNSLMPGAFGAIYPRNEASALQSTPEEQAAAFEFRWQRGGLSFLGAFGDLLLNAEANQLAADFVRRKISATVHNPEIAAKLTPKHVIGCKRLVIDTGYFETFNRRNVELVDISNSPIERLTPHGLRAANQDFTLDCIVFATGFDAMTGAISKIDIRGRSGLKLSEKWQAGPRSYLGLNAQGFPNLFTISGPGSPSVLTNMLVSIEQHVNFIGECLRYMRSNGHTLIEAKLQAEDTWVDHVNNVANQTLYPSCNSWYLGANVPGKTRVFMPLVGFPPYVKKCEEVVASGYEGFEFSRES
jgi:cation diffusion facilitator CzcD-associated flavoprotein CzcO